MTRDEYKAKVDSLRTTYSKGGIFLVNRVLSEKTKAKDALGEIREHLQSLERGEDVVGALNGLDEEYLNIHQIAEKAKKNLKSLSKRAASHPELWEAYDAAVEKAAICLGWLDSFNIRLISWRAGDPGWGVNAGLRSRLEQAEVYLDMVYAYAAGFKAQDPAIRVLKPEHSG